MHTFNFVQQQISIKIFIIFILFSLNYFHKHIFFPDQTYFSGRTRITNQLFVASLFLTNFSFSSISSATPPCVYSFFLNNIIFAVLNRVSFPEENNGAAFLMAHVPKIITRPAQHNPEQASKRFKQQCGP